MAGGITVAIFGAGAVQAHAVSIAYERSPQVERIIVAPGNDFVARNRNKEVLLEKGCDLKDPASILAVVKKYNPDLIDLAQDDAVAGDAADILRQQGRHVFAPGQKAGHLESDKAWACGFTDRHKVLIPHTEIFDRTDHAYAHIDDLYHDDPNYLCFVKARGLCAGKGALKARSKEEAYRRVQQMALFGDAGKVFLIQEGLIGEECSVFAISDGNTYYPFRPARDHKLHLPFDEGDQTGGMGASSPLLGWSERFFHRVHGEIVGKQIHGMEQEGMPYQGILYVGGMLVRRGSILAPFVIEDNARWGDPDGGPVLLGIVADYAEMVEAARTGGLKEFLARRDALGHPIAIEDNRCRVSVVGTARGYPGNYSAVRGKRIYGIEEAEKVPFVTILGAGMAIVDDKFYADGGRLFDIVARGSTITRARQRAYEAMAHIYIEGNNLNYRHDIAWQEMEKFYA